MIPKVAIYTKLSADRELVMGSQIMHRRNARQGNKIDSGIP